MFYYVSGIYLTVTMAMTSLSIVLTVFVLQLHHVGPHQKAVPGWIKQIVIRYIARILCMRSHIASYYGCTLEEAEAKRNEMCLTSFIDNMDYKDLNNCNGRLTQNHLYTGMPGSSHVVDNKYERIPYNPHQAHQYARTYQLGPNVPSPGPGGHTSRGGGNNGALSYDKISNHLKILVSKYDNEDEYQDIMNEWRLVAHIMDRFLFWLFLIGSVLSSVSILVFQPMTKPPLT